MPEWLVRVVLLLGLEALRKGLFPLRGILLRVPKCAHHDKSILTILVKVVPSPSPTFASLRVQNIVLAQHNVQVELTQRVGFFQGPAKSQDLRHRWERYRHGHITRLREVFLRV